MINPQQLAECVSNQRLQLILMPTEACNFRCTYCYEDFALGRMEPWVVGGVKHLISRRAPELRELDIGWFGGEPLLACDIIEEIMSHAQAEALVHPSMRVTSNMSTNGYTLSRTTFLRLLRLGVTSYQISFDGPQRWHDSRRVRMNGEGSFQHIWDNLLALRTIEGTFSVTVRLHVDRDNHSSIPEFLMAYEKAFSKDPRFPLFVRRLARLGGSNDAQFRIFEHGDADEALRPLRDLATQMDIPQTGEVHGICYASKSNSLVVRADGRINKCTVAIEHPNNQIGWIDAEGHVQQDAKRMWMWMRGLWTQDEGVLECPMRGYADPGAAGSSGNVVVTLR